MSATLGLLLIAQLNSFEFTPITTPQLAGDSFNITVIARDINGNIYYDYNRPAFLSTSRGAIYIYPNVIGPFRSGVWQGRVMVTLAESLQIRCTDDSGRVTSSSNTFAVYPGPPARFLSIFPGQQLNPGTRDGRRGVPNNQSAGDSFVFTVYLTDEWCNPVGAGRDSFSLRATDSFAFLPRGEELNNGCRAITASFRQAGRHWVIIQPIYAQGLRSDTSAVFTVNPGAFFRLLLLVPGEISLPGDTAVSGWQTPGKAGIPLHQFVQEPFPVVVYGCDRCWNRVSAGGVTVSLRSDFAAQFIPAETTLIDSVVIAAKFNFPGTNQDIWVTDSEGRFESYRTRVDIRARGQSLEIIAPDTVFAGDTAFIRVVVLDANGEPVKQAVCRFEVTGGNGEMLDEALLTDTIGVAVARFLCTRAHFAEWDTIRISSGIADSLIAIYVNLPDSGLFSGRIIAFPNPFGYNRSTAEIYYYLNRSSGIDFRIYDPFGNEVVRYKFKQGQPGGRAGVNKVIWDGRNREGRRVASGIYVVQILGQLHTGTTFKSTYRLGVVW